MLTKQCGCVWYGSRTIASRKFGPNPKTYTSIDIYISQIVYKSWLHNVDLVWYKLVYNNIIINNDNNDNNNNNNNNNIYYYYYYHYYYYYYCYYHYYYEKYAFAKALI